MTSSDKTPPDSELALGVARATEYLIVDQFLRDFLGVQVLAYALDCGLIDSLLAHSTSVFDADPMGSELVFGVLLRDGIVEDLGSSYQVTGSFRHALKFRDLLEAKIKFSRMLAPDVIERLPKLLTDPDAFFAESALFSLFDYSRALEVSPENLAATKKWVDLTTALTRYEGNALRQHLIVDGTTFDTARQWLDVGGNSGEFAGQLVREHSKLNVSVLDLPVVCELGRDHLKGWPGADRIRFIAGDALSEALPEGNDVVSFKSMLHDWPEPAVEILLGRAFDALKPGGQVLVFERGQVDWQSTVPTFGNLATQLFFRSYRTSEFYRQKLEESGFADIQCRSLQLEMPFHVITARAPD